MPSPFSAQLKRNIQMSCLSKGSLNWKLRDKESVICPIWMLRRVVLYVVLSLYMKFNGYHQTLIILTNRFADFKDLLFDLDRWPQAQNFSRDQFHVYFLSVTTIISLLTIKQRGKKCRADILDQNRKSGSLNLTFWPCHKNFT